MIYKAFGIVNMPRTHIHVAGMGEERPIGAFSFLGRYRLVDFPISNFSNSGIDRIQVYLNKNPRSLVEHIGTGRHFNINSKSGRLQLLFAPEQQNPIYDTDIAAFEANLDSTDLMHHQYVVIAPSNMIFKQDFDALINTHVESGADITLLYHTVDNAKEEFRSCDTLELNKQKGVISIEKNRGTAKTKHIFMETYVMSKDLFLDLIKKAKSVSSVYTLAHIVSDMCETLDVRGVSHRGYFAAITDFKSYYDTNLQLTNINVARQLFDDNWTIYTKTNDSCPTHYHSEAIVKGSVISNGCDIEGTVINSILGRGVVVKAGAIVKNSIILADSVIGENVVVDSQVIDRNAQLIHIKEAVATPDSPGFVKRFDVL